MTESACCKISFRIGALASVQKSLIGSRLQERLSDRRDRGRGPARRRPARRCEVEDEAKVQNTKMETAKFTDSGRSKQIKTLKLISMGIEFLISSIWPHDGARWLLQSLSGWTVCVLSVYRFLSVRNAADRFEQSEQSRLRTSGFKFKMIDFTAQLSPTMESS